MLLPLGYHDSDGTSKIAIMHKRAMTQPHGLAKSLFVAEIISSDRSNIFRRHRSKCVLSGEHVVVALL